MEVNREKVKKWSADEVPQVVRLPFGKGGAHPS